MEIITVLLISLALAMDSFSVSTIAGTSLKTIKYQQAILIASYFGFFQFFMTYLGWYGGSVFSKTMNGADHWIAFGLLAIIGGRMILESFKDQEERIFVLNHKVLFILAIATSIDALGVGISYSLLDEPILFISIVIGITAFVLSYVGVYLGKSLQKLLKNKMELIGGIVLIGIGIKIFIENGVF